MKLMCELNEDVRFLVEEKEGKKQYFIEGIFMQADIANRNGRMYRSSVLEKEVGRYNREYVLENRAFGELGHPQGPNINLERTAILIKSLVKENSNFIGISKSIFHGP